MVAVSESGKSKLDTIKLLLALVLLGLGVAGFYYLENESQLYRVLALLAVSAVAVGVVYTTALGRRINGFRKDSFLEVRKVVWPSRQETIQTTLIVIVAVFIIGIFLWLLDMLLLWGVQVLTGQGG
ncbi:MAG: preprotein translocase subunit SecE [Gammaproteobacteria bacterium]|nr:preprotein translocase subunit SecE [Gammaproteobacteria bacterium]